MIRDLAAAPERERTEPLPDPPRPPLVLIVDDQEWTARAFESVIGPAGFAVLRCPSARQALEQARTVAPDLVLVKADLPDRSGVQLCRLLRRELRVGAATPIFLTAAAPLKREQRLEALRAGAWDIFTPPLDAEELVLRLRAHVHAKFEADRAREQSLVDQATGLYSVHGLLRRVREMGLEAVRHPAPLGCVVVAPEDGADEAYAAHREAALTERMVQLVTAAGRRSDVVGRLSQTEFAVIAHHADPTGVRRLAHRLVRAAEQADQSLRVRVGCYAVESLGTALDPVELLVRATVALRRAQRDTGAPPVCFFEQVVSLS